jgi:hypothetical protein
VAITRQLRAVSGIAATWGVAFSVIGTTTLLTGMAFRVLPPELVGLKPLVLVATRAFVAGVVAGAVFATVFARAERNRTLATLSARRVALWGFIGACLPTAVTLGLGAARLVPVGIMGAACLGYGVIGGTLSIAMLKLARRAPALEAESGLL